MTLPGALDWQNQYAETAFLLGSTSRNSNAAFTVDITATLAPQHMGIVVALVPKAGNACASVDWQVFDSTLGIGLLLDTAQSMTQPTMQALAFPGQYVVLNPANTIIVQFLPNGVGNLVADVYVYGVTTMPITLPQTHLPDRSVLLNSGIINVPAGTTGNVLSQAQPGFINRVKMMSANHVAAAAAVARVSWVDQFSANPHIETLDTAVANFVWNNLVDFDNTVGLSYVNGSSVAHRCMVAFEQVPQ